VEKWCHNRKTRHIPIGRDFWDLSSLVQENTIKTEKNEKKKEIKTAKVFLRLVVGHAITKQVRAVFKEHSQLTIGIVADGDNPGYLGRGRFFHCGAIFPRTIQ
jgi:hypothetical protein